MGRSPSRQARKGEQTRAAILDATSSLIAERGVDAFTISEVALRGKVNRALIYHYFKDRDNLVVNALDRIIQQSEDAQGELGAGDAVEANVRLHIRHPEIARVFFQLLLNNRPLLRIGERIQRTIQALSDFKRASAVDEEADPEMAFVIFLLAQTAWPFSRNEMARLLGVSVEEADERFISAIRWATETGMRVMSPDTGHQE
ncbi:MAG: helix-turn-helix domain-containing protein [Dehalococcoidia bacterium]